MAGQEKPKTNWPRINADRRGSGRLKKQIWRGDCQRRAVPDGTRLSLHFAVPPLTWRAMYWRACGAGQPHCCPATHMAGYVLPHLRRWAIGLLHEEENWPRIGKNQRQISRGSTRIRKIKETNCRGGCQRRAVPDGTRLSLHFAVPPLTWRAMYWRASGAGQPHCCPATHVAGYVLPRLRRWATTLPSRHSRGGLCTAAPAALGNQTAVPPLTWRAMYCRAIRLPRRWPAAG
jgi:hypothetical protein